jgi:hypothetical protein
MKNFSPPVKLFRANLNISFLISKTKALRNFPNTLTVWLREQDLNLRPSGYEPDELPTAPSRVRQREGALSRH